MVDHTDEHLFKNEFEKTFYYQKNKKSVIDLKKEDIFYAEYCLGKEKNGSIVFISKKVISDENSSGYLAKSYFNTKGRLVAYIVERNEKEGSKEYSVKNLIYFDENSTVLREKDYYYLNGKISYGPNPIYRTGAVSPYELTLYDFFSVNAFIGIKKSDFIYSRLANPVGSGSGHGSGNDSGSRSGGSLAYALGNRKVLVKPPLDYTCKEEGKVVVQVTVDKSGNTISAIAGVKGTTNNTPCLLEQARRAALNTKWQASADAPDKQIGKITYNFSQNKLFELLNN